MNIELITKIFGINILIYWVYFQILNKKEIKVKVIVQILLSCIINTIVYVLMKDNIGQIFNIIVSYFIQILCLKLIMKDKSETIFSTNLIANSIVYLTFGISMLIEMVPMIIFKIQNKLLNIYIILIIQIVILIAFFHIKRIKNGFSFLKNKANSEYIDIIMINISAVVILAYCLFGNYKGDLTIHLIISFMIISAIMLIMIQKTLTLYYKQRLLNKTIEDYKNDIATKDEQIKQLSEEKFKISKLNHEFYNRQKALEKKVKELVNNANFNMETASELSVTKQIESLTKEYSAKLQEIKNVEKLPSTGIEEIDDMFKYMQSECKENNIDFKLQINGNIHHLVNTIIPQNKLVTLIGDHIRDAIIAVNSSSNNYKSIIAILGIKDKTYEFCVYDTGIEFEIDTLTKLGIEPATTHKETGGTGIGFMTTFETLKETNASLIIEEKHEMSENDYTKAVIIRFDGKNEYKVRSYRAAKIDKNDRIIIEQI